MPVASPSQLWSSLDPEIRLLAAKSLYAHDWGQTPTRREADFAIMHGMRFRESAVRQLPVDRRAHYLARSIRPTDSLAGSLLLALHLEHRRALLAAFLDALDIPHTEGLINEDHDLKPPTAAAIKKATKALTGKFPLEEVQLYLTTLFVLDPDTWAGLGDTPLFLTNSN